MHLLIYAGLVVGMSIPQSALPICYEYSCELVFPIHECIPNAVLVLLANTTSILFFFLITLTGMRSHKVTSQGCIGGN